MTKKASKASESLGTIGNKIEKPKVEPKADTPKVLPKTRIEGQYILINRIAFQLWLNDLSLTRSIKWIQNHHTWKPRYKDFDNNHFAKLKGMKRSHLKRGFSDIAQNLTTFPDGLIAVGRPFKVIPAGIKGKNRYAICIEHLGNFDIGGDIMTSEHRETIIWLNAVLCKKFDLTPDKNSIIYHHWYNPKWCPGTNFFGGNTIEDAEQNFIPLIKNA